MIGGVAAIASAPGLDHDQRRMSVLARTPGDLEKSLYRPAASPRLWPLERGLTFLNHGSFGSCPRAVLGVQREIQTRLERQPIRFFVRDLEGLMDEARTVVARFVGARAADLVAVANATTGVNTFLRAFPSRAGDEWLVTDHEYNACRNALDVVAGKRGVRVVVVPVPFPIRTMDGTVEALLAGVTRRTRLALIDHVTSPTGLVLPLERIVRALRDRGVETLVDGAHAPGMVALDLNRLGAAAYTGNCHKWMCAPKGAAFLHVRREFQTCVRPLVISHGANTRRRDRSRFLIEFGWVGTSDPSAFLAVPRAIEWMGSALAGGWDEVMRRNRDLALAARRHLGGVLGVEMPCPDDGIGAMAALALPDGRSGRGPQSPLYLDPLQDRLLGEYGIEVPVIPWPAAPRRLVRVSAQLYNHFGEYERLGDALRREVGR
jgi:isopenicillin-N epimerase